MKNLALATALLLASACSNTPSVTGDRPVDVVTKTITCTIESLDATSCALKENSEVKAVEAVADIQSLFAGNSPCAEEEGLGEADSNGYSIVYGLSVGGFCTSSTISYSAPSATQLRAEATRTVVKVQLKQAAKPAEPVDDTWDTSFPPFPPAPSLPTNGDDEEENTGGSGPSGPGATAECNEGDFDNIARFAVPSIGSGILNLGRDYANNRITSDLHIELDLRTCVDGHIVSLLDGTSKPYVSIETNNISMQNAESHVFSSTIKDSNDTLLSSPNFTACTGVDACDNARTIAARADLQSIGSLGKTALKLEITDNTALAPVGVSPQAFAADNYSILVRLYDDNGTIAVESLFVPASATTVYREVNFAASVVPADTLNIDANTSATYFGVSEGLTLEGQFASAGKLFANNAVGEYDVFSPIDNQVFNASDYRDIDYIRIHKIARAARSGPMSTIKILFTKTGNSQVYSFFSVGANAIRFSQNSTSVLDIGDVTNLIDDYYTANTSFQP